MSGNCYTEPEWKSYPKNMENQLHSLCSYMAMFPASIPNFFINKYSKVGDTVLDPFSGRGTVPLEACFLKRIGIGNDLNPLAYVLTKAKTNVPNRAWIEGKIDRLEEEYYNTYNSYDNEVPWKIDMLFHDKTLDQLLFLKNKLDWKRRKIDCFLTAMILGIMHGNSKGYLSISMPNTFSMSPNYVKKYIEDNGLEHPKRDVFHLLRSKLERCYQKPLNDGKVYYSDSRKLGWIKDESIDLIVTSPPYTRVIRYGAYNWIRLWFLDKEPKSVDNDLLCTSSTDKYESFMKEFLREMYRVLKDDGKFIMIIGDVRKKNANNEYINLSERVWNNCAKPLSYNLDKTIEDRISSVNISATYGDELLENRSTTRKLPGGTSTKLFISSNISS